MPSAKPAIAKAKPAPAPRHRRGQSVSPAKRSNGMLPSPHSSRCRPNMPSGSMRCPRRCLTAASARDYKQSPGKARGPISIWSGWPASNRRAASGGIEHCVATRDCASPTGAHRHSPRTAPPDSLAVAPQCARPPYGQTTRSAGGTSRSTNRNQGSQFRMSFDKQLLEQLAWGSSATSRIAFRSLPGKPNENPTRALNTYRASAAACR